MGEVWTLELVPWFYFKCEFIIISLILPPRRTMKPELLFPLSKKNLHRCWLSSLVGSVCWRWQTPWCQNFRKHVYAGETWRLLEAIVVLNQPKACPSTSQREMDCSSVISNVSSYIVCSCTFQPFVSRTIFGRYWSTILIGRVVSC
jgi:hypothetical protein